MTKLLLVFNLLILSALPIFAQHTIESNGTIKGIVTTSDHKPAAAVTIQIKELKKATVTNDNGEFIFKSIQPGSYEVEITSIGYNKIQQAVNVDAGKTAAVGFLLTESQEQLKEVVISTRRKSYISEHNYVKA